MNALASRERHAGSVLLLPEMAGALSRLAGENRALATRLLRKVREDLESFELVPADIAQAEFASKLAAERRLRGADAVHLAGACLMAREFRRGFRFVTSDVEQAAAARSERLKVIQIG
jgi:predicted nucleic acid-binding protein